MIEEEDFSEGIELKQADRSFADSFRSRKLGKQITPGSDTPKASDQLKKDYLKLTAKKTKKTMVQQRKKIIPNFKRSLFNINDDYEDQENVDPIQHREANDVDGIEAFHADVTIDRRHPRSNRSERKAYWIFTNQDQLRVRVSYELESLQCVVISK